MNPPGDMIRLQSHRKRFESAVRKGKYYFLKHCKKFDIENIDKRENIQKSFIEGF